MDEAAFHSRGRQLRHSCNRFKRLSNRERDRPGTAESFSVSGTIETRRNGRTPTATKGAAMAVRGIAFVLTGLLLGGCMQATVGDPASEANFTARDKKLLANAPYSK